MATTRVESRQPSHGEEVRSHEPDDSPLVHEATPPLEFEATPEITRGTSPNTLLGLNTALGPDCCEIGPAQSWREPESHLASTDSAPADKAASTSQEAVDPLVEGFGHVMQDSPADPGGGIAFPKPTRQLRTRPAKRRRRASTMDSVTATSDEEVPTYKQRRVTTSGGLRCDAQPTLRPAQKLRTRPPGRSTSRRRAGAGALLPKESQVTDHADASYQEWPLPDAVLQRIQVNGRAILQLQFTWATPCASHEATAAKPMAQLPELPRTRRGCGTNARASKKPPSNGSAESTDAGDTGEETDIHIATRVLARWKRWTYLLEWADGTTTWKPKRNILDRQMMDDFEATYRGFNAGVDVLGSRTWKGRQQWRVHWHGRPDPEDRWVDEKLMDPAQVEKVKASGFENLGD